MKKVRALLWLASVCCAAGLRAGDAAFEVRAVAPHAGMGNEYVLDDGGGDPVKLSLGSDILLDATALVSAEAKTDQGFWFIAVELNAAGKARLAEITTTFQGRRLAILINGKLRCAPVVNAPILDGSFEIAGNFTEAEVKALAADLNAAAGKKELPSAAPATPATPTATPCSP